MMKYLKIFFEYLFFALLITVSLILALDKRYSGVILEGLKLWLACVVPSLFPYFFITTCLSNLKATSRICSFCFPLTKRMFNVSGAVGYAYFMSVISGYPVGAKIVSDLRQKNIISHTESIRASALCSTSSPMFLIGSVGNLMFNNRLFGMLLLLTHLTCSIIIGVIFSFYKKDQKASNSLPPLNSQMDNILYESAYSSVISVLVVGGLITIFYLLTQMLFNLHILDGIISVFSLLFKDKDLATGLCLGLFECTTGLKQVSTANFSVISLPICAFICGFSGLSAIMQSIAYLKKAKIKTAVFLVSKLISAVLNFMVGLIFSLIF